MFHPPTSNNVLCFIGWMQSMGPEDLDLRCGQSIGVLYIPMDLLSNMYIQYNIIYYIIYIYYILYIYMSICVYGYQCTYIYIYIYIHLYCIYFEYIIYITTNRTASGRLPISLGGGKT
jgi:hypothetical protein